MKKALLIIMALLLSLSLPLSLVSCGGDEVSEGGSQQTSAPEGSAPAESVPEGSAPEDSVPDEDSTEASRPEGSETVKVENGLVVYMPADRPLRIAQFADIHFGIEGNAYHNNKVERTKKYMQYIVDTEKPDLIVCSGDNILSTGLEALKEFVALMDSYKIPWTFIYGNHDAESNSAGYSKKELSAYLDSCGSEYLLYNSGYVESSANRYGNFSVSVLNSDGTKLLGAVILLDAGTYDGAKSDYESITKGQIDWYKTEIEKLDSLYTGEGVMPSIVFSHIQIPEYYTAYKAALKGSGAEFVIKQELPSSEIEGILTGGPSKENTGFFDAMKEKASTVAFFCGHAHTFDFQVKMDGIVMGFGPQTGFSTLFENNDMPRRTYIYNFDEDFNFTTDCCTEEGSGLGLNYCGTFDSAAEYDEATGKYTVSHNFNYGNDIVFSYNGVRLTTENTKFEGEVRISTQAQWKGGFYCPDGMTLIFDGVTGLTCNFTYDPSSKTLTVETESVAVDPNAPKTVEVKSVNKDAGADAVAVWTEAGTKVKYVTDASKGEGNWIGNGWRYYIVIDSEGRIAYAVLWPLNGYGGPTGTGYYTHMVYSSDYNKNPAIVLLDGFANDWAAGGFGYTLFEIVVPEGGFAITSHGVTNYALVDMLSQGTVEDYGVANINTRSIYNNNIRVHYDAATGTISVTTVEE
ncbi:MAG: metallophosphoesterase [Clostridia bacterium]|nr:metallophosphoesterase [Clostridia bacterium]